MAFSLKVGHDVNEKNRLEYYVSGSGAMSEALDIDKDLVIREARLHLSAAATQETFAIDVDSGKGVAFDIKLFAWDMSADESGNPGTVKDVIWRPETLVLVDKDDLITCSWTNTDAVTWGLSLIVSTGR